MIARRRLRAPIDQDFGSWAEQLFGEQAMRAAVGLVGVITYDAPAERLSAAFVWERLLRATAPRYPAVRYITGGWGRVIERMATHAVKLGTRIDAARSLLGDDSLRWEPGHSILLDLGVGTRRKDAFVVSDLDRGGFAERYSMPDPSLAPPGHSLVQAQRPVAEGESRDQALSRLEDLVELGLPGWRDRTTWRREQACLGRTGALDLPGFTWRDRPAVDRGGDVWLAGDSVAAPGLLSEVSINSALRAATLAQRQVGAHLN